MGDINFYFLNFSYRGLAFVSPLDRENGDRNPKEKLVKIPVPKFGFIVLVVSGGGFLGLIFFFSFPPLGALVFTYGNSKDYYRYDLYSSTKKRFLFFLTNLLVKSFTYETIQLENK